MLRQVLSPMWLGRGTPIRSNVERWAWRLRWIAIAWIVVFWRLGYLSLLDPDEAHYAELTREMVQGGNWLVPLLDGQPLIDKPVIFHWLQGLSVALLGESEFAVRLPSALAALVLFVLTRWVGVLMFGAAVGEWAAIMLATIPATFALSSVGLFDMVFTMTRGGPGAATELISIYIQRLGFRVFDMGTASAQAIMLLVLTIVLSRMYIRVFYREIQ